MKAGIINYVIIIIIFSIAMTGYKFSLSPFKIKVNSWQEATGWVLLIIAVALISHGSGKREYMDGYKDGLKDATEFLKP